VIGLVDEDGNDLADFHYDGFGNLRSSTGVAADPLADLCGVLDAACIDLKGFTEDYYRDMTGGSLGPVLETLKTLGRKGIHTELVTLIVPGRNDDMDTLRAMCDWIVESLGPDVPIHFTKFYPQYKLKAVQPTPLATLEAAHETARNAGLHYVYIGNVYGHAAESTYCPGCGQMVIKRAGYETTLVGLEDGSCTGCRTNIPGIWSISQLRGK
jgi:pyruvate formate lyase activating enzyme